MIAGSDFVRELQSAGVTHIIWIPDSDLGSWDRDLSSASNLSLVRVCREGEAFAVAAGLWIGGQRPIVAMQCTGLFEAGDSLRNVIHDLGVPIFCIVGVRGARASRTSGTSDTCPRFTEPIVRAWQIPFVTLADNATAVDLVNEYRLSLAHGQARFVLIPE